MTRILVQSTVEGILRFLHDLPSAFQFLKPPAPSTPTTGSTRAINGINLDIKHPLGKPNASMLDGIDWVRFVYDVSQGRGSTDLELAHRIHAPYIDHYLKAGKKVMLVCTHQLYGEGAGFNWLAMNRAQWRALSVRYADIIHDLAKRWKGAAVIYQIMNEMDAALGSIASVSIPADDYGAILGDAIRAIKAADPKAVVITGGSLSGAVNGPNYLKRAIDNTGGVKPDGVAFHAYGLHGGAGTQYAPFGHMATAVNNYAAVIPGKKVYITEWGILGQPHLAASSVASYASAFLNYAKNSGKVEAAIWYAWAESMHDGYGIVNVNNVPRTALRNVFR